MGPKKKVVEEERQLLGRPGNTVKIGVVGVPNVGKSSFFNLLSKLNVPAENFPFCTIEPNEAMVPVPDQRFNWLVEHHKPASVVPPVIRVTDIAGLVKGASEGAGLGNAFLSHISARARRAARAMPRAPCRAATPFARAAPRRALSVVVARAPLAQATDAIYMMLRAFDDPDVTHVEGDVDPVRDMQIITQELVLKDLTIVKNEVESKRKNVDRGVGGKDAKMEFQSLEKIVACLEEGKPVRFGSWSPLDIDVLNKRQLNTAKEIVYLINLSAKDFLRKKNKWLPKIAEAVTASGGGVTIPFSVEHEQSLLDMELAGQLDEFLKENPTQKSILPRILKQGYKALRLVHFFTGGKDEVKAWTLKQGRLAPQAAGCIHTDFEKGFIMAEVHSFEDLKELGSEEAVKKAGKYHQKGKTYVVQDGDIIFFKFNT